MNVPEDLYYSKDHEWARVEGDIATIGITDYAQNSLGDIVYVVLPSVGESFSANQEVGEVNSVKAASEIYTPVSGDVVEVNSLLIGDDDNTKLVNEEPYGSGWMVRIRMSDPGELDRLKSAAEYEEFIKPLTEKNE